MYTARVLLRSMCALLFLSSCATTPSTPQERYLAVLRAAHASRPDCYTSASAVRVDPATSPACQEADMKWARGVTEARSQLDEAELAAAPACISEWRISETALRGAGVDPADTQGIAKVIRRGYVVGQYLGTACGQEVCSWQRLRHQDSGFCEHAEEVNANASAAGERRTREGK